MKLFTPLFRNTQALEAKINSKEIERLRELLSASEGEVTENQEEIQRLQSDLDGMQGKIGEKEQQLSALLVQLSEAKQRLKTAEVEEKRVNDQISKILWEIDDKTQTAIGNVHLGMTVTEVRKVAGAPRSTNHCFISFPIATGSVVPNLSCTSIP